MSPRRGQFASQKSIDKAERLLDQLREQQVNTGPICIFLLFNTSYIHLLYAETIDRCFKVEKTLLGDELKFKAIPIDSFQLSKGPISIS